MRIALGLSYLGSAYHGWQAQPSGRAVEDHVRVALSRFMAVPCPDLVCAGRTDAGVHAAMQVIHFDAPVERDTWSWVRGVNRYLPADVAVQFALNAAPNFHARFDAITRRYAYLVLESPVRPSIDTGRVGWSSRALNGDAMQRAANLLIGTHDFSSFRAAQCQARSPVRTLLRASVTRRGQHWRFDFEGNAFLHHMIRNIMGSLIAVGQGLHPGDWMGDVLAAKSRMAASPTFAASGLYFLGPTYNEVLGLPRQTPAFDWLP